MQSHTRRKFQPNISKDNSAKLSELPLSIRTLIKTVSTEQLENFLSYDCFTILYVLTENSSEGKLKPLRDKDRNFNIIIFRK